MPKLRPKTPRSAPAKLVPLIEAAESYSVSVDTLRRAIAAGDLTGYRLGSKILRVSPDEVERLFRTTPTTNGASPSAAQGE